MSRRNKPIKPFPVTHHWRTGEWFPMGEFENGERELLAAEGLDVHTYKTRRAAMVGKSQRLALEVEIVCFHYLKGRRPKRIVELEINYPHE